MKSIKINIIKTVGQFLADFLIERMKVCIEKNDNKEFDRLFNQAAILCAYCEVMHDIHLD